jgi:hypothetical protein
MIKKYLVLITFAVIFTSGLISIAHASQDDEKAAVRSAQEWLDLIDEGQYEKSWHESAAFLKNAIAKEQWTQSMKAFRMPLGKVIFRRLKTKKYVTSLPGASDGHYVVIQFNASFTQKKSAVETIPMLDKDGKWRVSGYYIK